MALSDLFTVTQLELVMGGAYRLVELAQASSTADPKYTAFVAQVRVASQGDVYSIMQVAFDPLDPTVATSPVAQSYCLACAVYWAWSYGTGGQAVPDPVVRNRDLAMQALDVIRRGNSGLGTSTEPVSQMPTKQVDMDATGTSGLTGSGWTRSNWGGFCVFFLTCGLGWFLLSCAHDRLSCLWVA